LQKIAIVGLAGIGRTQIALEFAQLMKREWTEYSLFWVPAVSLESTLAQGQVMALSSVPFASDRQVFKGMQQMII
jgi:hypothetical protein